MRSYKPYSIIYYRGISRVVVVSSGSEGCPDGYHSVEDDETGQCYDNDLGCQYDDLIFNEDKTA